MPDFYNIQTNRADCADHDLAFKKAGETLTRDTHEPISSEYICPDLAIKRGDLKLN